MKIDVDHIKDENKTREDQITNLYEEQKKESKEREDKLMNHLEKTTDTLYEIKNGMQSMTTEINTLKQGVNKVWEHIEKEEKDK